MVAEVTSSGSVGQTTQTRARELEQAQTVRQARREQGNAGVEVRIGQRETQRAQASDGLTYENIRPRNGSVPQVERGNEPRETDQTLRPQGEVAPQEQVQAGEPRQASEALNNLT